MKAARALQLILVLVAACSSGDKSAPQHSAAPARRKTAANDAGGKPDSQREEDHVDAGARGAAEPKASMNDGGPPDGGDAASAAGGAAGTSATHAGASAASDTPQGGMGGNSSTDAGARATAGAAGLSWELSGHWSEPAVFEDGSADIWAISVAQNRSGDTVVGWLQSMPDAFYWMRRFVNGAWEPVPFRLGNDVRPPSGDTGNFWIDIDPNGVAELFYRNNDPSTPMTLKTYWSAWKGETVALVDAAPVIFGAPNTIGFPGGLTITDSGQSIVLWSESGSGSPPQTLHANIRSDAGDWGVPQRLGDLDDLFLAIGMGTNHAGQLLFAAVSAPAVHIGQINIVPGENTMHTFVIDGPSARELPSFAMPDSIQGNRVYAALDAAGNGALLYVAGNRNLFAAHYRAATNTWTGPEKLTDKFVVGCRLLIMPSGELLALSQEYTSHPDALGNDDPPALFGIMTARRYADGSGWSAPETLSDTDYFDLGFDAAVGPSGDAIVVWAQKRDRIGPADGAILSRRLIQNKWSSTEVVRRYLAWGGVKYAGDVQIEGVTLAEDGRALLIMTNRATPDNTFRPKDLEWMRSM